MLFSILFSQAYYAVLGAYWGKHEHSFGKGRVMITSTGVNALRQERLDRIRSGEPFTVAIVGLGYVGLPLALAFAKQGHTVIGIDQSSARVKDVVDGSSPLRHLSSTDIQTLVGRGLLKASTEYSAAVEADVIIICVPTPLHEDKSPDLSSVRSAATSIAAVLTVGQLVVVESTSWPGTTAEVVRPILESRGLICNDDFNLAFSPEREDPGNVSFTTTTIPKVVGADDVAAGELAAATYRRVCTTVVQVSSTRVAEAAKLTENAFRAVNIALVNELKLLLSEMDIDVWEVIAAAATKPFGFMAFQPGPGVGGHCIPVDPHYLAAKAREYVRPTRLIEVATAINDSMPDHIVSRLAAAIDFSTGRGFRGTRILILGVAYKKNIEDIRESPSLRIFDLLLKRGADISYFDPLVPESSLQGWSIARVDILDPPTIKGFDAVLICTDHDQVDYQLVADSAVLILDTRNVYSRLGIRALNVVKA